MGATGATNIESPHVDDITVLLHVCGDSIEYVSPATGGRIRWPVCSVPYVLSPLASTAAVRLATSYAKYILRVTPFISLHWHRVHHTH